MTTVDHRMERTVSDPDARDAKLSDVLQAISPIGLENAVKALETRVEQLEAALRPVAQEGCIRLRRGNVLIRTEPCGRCTSCRARAALASSEGGTT